MKCRFRDSGHCSSPAIRPLPDVCGARENGEAAKAPPCGTLRLRSSGAVFRSRPQNEEYKRHEGLLRLPVLQSSRSVVISV